MIEPSPAADLVRKFANTVDLEDGTDELVSPTGAAKWLRANGFGTVRVTAANLERLLELRTGIRAVLAGESSDVVLADVPVLVGLTGDVLRPSPGLSPLHAVLARIAIAWAAVVVTGELERLKRCADDACGWVFWDVSRNHSRRWCTMRVCGNRAKARAYSARQRTRGPLPAAEH